MALLRQTYVNIAELQFERNEQSVVVALWASRQDDGSPISFSC